MKLFLIILALNSICIAQNGWFWQNPVPQGNELLEVKFFTEDIGYAAGYHGTILKTTDAGNSWKLLPLETSESIWLMVPRNDDLGIAIGPNSIYTTFDDGGNWIENIYDSLLFTGFYKINNFVTIIVGMTDYGPLILKTSDGGITWSRKTASTFESFNTVSFADSVNGIAAGPNNNVFKTADAGETWFRLPDPERTIISISYLDDSLIIAGGPSFISRSTDGGNTWSKTYDNDYISIDNMVFYDKQNGLAISMPGTLLKTTDAGISWNNVPLGSLQMNQICYFDSACIITKSANKTTLYFSYDQGNTWSEKTIYERNTHLYDLAFSTKENAVATGLGGYVFHTTNNGQVWEKTVVDESKILRSVSFTDSVNGMIVGTNGVMYKTTDAGYTWLNIPAVTGEQLYDIMAVDDSSYYACGANGVLLYSGDKGETWNIKETETKNVLVKLFFTDGNNGFIISNSDTIIKTTDGGNTWSSIVNVVYPSTGMWFFNSLSGIVGDNSGNFYLTNDGGETWNKTETGILCSIKDISFIDSSNGWAACSYGYLFRTKDGGASWTQQESGTNNNLNAIVFTDKYTGTAAGNHGTILHTKSGGLTLVENDGPGTISGFSLWQNYPNPFNPVTTIKYEISGMNHVTLKIYDILGREAATLVDEEKPAGIYYVNFNGEGLSSGVYFYSLRAGSSSQTKKLILLK